MGNTYARLPLNFQKANFHSGRVVTLNNRGLTMSSLCKKISSSRSASGAIGALCVLFVLAPVVVRAQATIRPLSDFLDKQVVSSVNGSPFIIWDNTNLTRYLSIDYSGKVNDFIVSKGGPNSGTTVTGTVMERPLKNGTAEITVQLHLENAIVWGNQVIGNATPLVFGHTPLQIVNGADPALGKVNLTLKFTISAPGAPLADLSTIAFTTKTEVFQQLNTVAQGTFRAAYGVPEGTPGFAHTTQTGIYQSKGNGGPYGDYFPAGFIDFDVNQ
jgi:hypothetical protein